MQDRERVLAVLAGSARDRVPWFGDLSYWAHAMEIRGEVPAGWQQTQDYYGFHRGLGVGFYLQGYWAFRAKADSSVSIETREEDERHVRLVHTPVGTLREETRYLPEAFTWAITRHLVSSVEDLRVLRYWWEHTDLAPDPDEAVRRRPWVGDGGLVLCYLPRSPFQEMNVALAGIANVVDLWADHRSEFEKTLQLLGERFDEAAEAALTVPADCFMIPENLSSEAVGRFYARYVRPWEIKWTARIREAGRHSFIHMDGTLGLLDQVSEAGFDVIEAFTPAPVGDLSIEAARALAGPGPVLWGGLPGIYFTSLVDDDTFERYVRETITTMAQDGRMVLGVADQVPPDGLHARVERVAELVERYGRYA